MQGWWTSGVLLSLAWGVAAFGSPYRWGYIPLLMSSAVLGLIGAVWGKGSLPKFVLSGFLLLGAAISLQLVPLPLAQLTRISPNAIRLVSQRELQFQPNAGVTHAISIEPPRTVRGLVFMSILGLLSVGSTRMFSRNSARRFVAGLVVLGAAVAVVGIVQSATFDGRIYGFFTPEVIGVSYGPFINRNHFAGWMLMAIPTSIGLLMAMLSKALPGLRPEARHRLVWLASTDGSKVLLTGFAIFLMALSLVLTLSRSGLLSFVVAVGLLAVSIARRLRGTQRGLAVFYLAAILVASLAWTGFDRLATRFGEQSTIDGSGRLGIWADTLRIAGDFWLTGTGLNTYTVSTLFYQTAVPGEHLGAAHNEYLQLAAEGGLLLAVPILFTVGALIVHVRRRFQQDVGSIWWLRLGAVTGLAAIAVQSFFEFSLQMPANAATFVVLIGLASHDGRRS